MKIINVLVRDKDYESWWVERGKIKQEGTISKFRFSDKIKRNHLLGIRCKWRKQRTGIRDEKRIHGL